MNLVNDNLVRSLFNRLKASILNTGSTAILCALQTSPLIAGASGPSVGNPNVNEASEEPEPQAISPRMSARKVSESANAGTRFYATIDAKHVISDYYNETERRMRRQPSLQSKLQLGARLYGDRLDLSVAGGAVKLAASQAVYQRRPELIADLYAYKGTVLNLLWYNMLQVPVRESDRDPTEFSDTDKYDRDSLRGIDASVFTSGVAPVIKGETRLLGGKFQIRLGADAWTKLYSKPLYVDESNSDGGGGVGLVDSREDFGSEKFEDRALRYVHQESLAIGWSPGFATSLSADLGAHIESRYLPVYFRDETGGWDYTYMPERRSFWKGKLAWDVNQTWSLQNETYTYRNGFFAENRVNGERRYKNVMRLSAKL